MDAFIEGSETFRGYARAIGTTSKAKKKPMMPQLYKRLKLSRYTNGWILGVLILLFCVDPALGAIAIDANVSTNRSNSSTSITSPSFSTISSNELLLAFVATDGKSAGMTVTGVTGGGLTWVLVRRTNVQMGTAEIWRAFAPARLSSVTVRANLSQSVAASITIVSFTGVDTSGTNGSGAIGATGSGNANPGGPTATLITTRNSSWVFGVGCDWDRAISRTLGPNQTMMNQYLASVGDTYWTQRQSAPTAPGGTTVTINDTAPTNDRYNLTIVEVLPAPVSGSTYTISGTVTPASLGSSATLSLSQGGIIISTTTVDATGNYSFTSVVNGTYTLTPVKSGVTFSPASQDVTVNGSDATASAFTSTASISGTISPTTSGAGTLVTLNGPNQLTMTATANASGFYSFTGLDTGSYTVTPSKTGYTFNPTLQTVSITTGGGTANFTATAMQTYSISGNISPANGGAGALVTLSGSPSNTTTADSSGNYNFSGLGSGTYTLTPSKTSYTFSPSSQLVTLPFNGGNATGVNFTATANAPSSLKFPDLSVIIPVGQISVAGSGSNRTFYYTHDTFNGGSGPLVIQPAYNQASGNYQGTQYIYSYSGGNWTLSQQIPVAGAFVFHAVHGHFHFPLASFGLYASNADGSIGPSVALSEKVGFCIADSFIYAPYLPNAGALGNLGPCTDPTSLRGLDIGAVDEYDRTDDGQSIIIGNLTDGTYWLRAVVDPDNYIAESDESNNETDVQLTIIGNTVNVLQTVVPVLPPPPDIALTWPLDGSAEAGTVDLAATTSSTGGVQFLVDGLPYGPVVTTMPYTLAWDTRTMQNGDHWLAAQTTDFTGRTGTSDIAKVTVSNGPAVDVTPPTVQVNAPVQGETVSASIPVAATAADDTAVINVQFYLDGSALGAPVTAPPYIVYWNTLTTSDGQHAISASATDSAGHIGYSTQVTVTVDNSHPANVIGKDVTVFVDGSNTMQTPVFSTITQDDLLVAFVGYDGPRASPQTATVSGAGLIWSLLKRSNVQWGTSEIWAARASGILTNVRVISQPGITGYHGSMTVIAFTNAAGPGVVGQASSLSGAPDIFLPGVAAGSWVFAVGNDWDRAVARVPTSGQVLVHQLVDTGVGDTFWVQSTIAPSSAFGLVTIHDDSPTSDQWNYAAVEIVATRQ